jgi:hypothetical protein
MFFMQQAGRERSRAARGLAVTAPFRVLLRRSDGLG